MHFNTRYLNFSPEPQPCKLTKRLRREKPIYEYSHDITSGIKIFTAKYYFSWSFVQKSNPISTWNVMQNATATATISHQEVETSRCARASHSGYSFYWTKNTLNSRKSQRTNQKYRNLEGSDHKCKGLLLFYLTNYSWSYWLSPTARSAFLSSISSTLV